MKPEKKSVLQELKDSTVILDLEDLRTVMHEILEEYQESHAEDPEEYLSTDEVIKILHISTKTFHRYREMRLIPFIQRGRKIYVKRSDLDAFQEANRIEDRYNR